MARPGTLALAACTLMLGGAPAVANAADADRRVTVTAVITKAAAGVGPRASDAELGRATITKHARQLKLGGHTGLRLADSVALPGVRRGTKVRQLRFVQTVGGLRVLWSQLDVGVLRGTVRGISGTSVRVPTSRLAGAQRLTPQAAVDIAKAAVPGDEQALPAQAIAYAGRPEAPKAPRRAYVVQVAPDGKTSGDTAQTVCVVVDASTGRVLDTWEGVAQQPVSGARGPRRATARATAPGETVLFQLVDGRNTTSVITPDYRDIITVGDPFAWGPLTPLTHRAYGAAVGPATLQAEGGMIGVGQYWCGFRGYCGRSLSVRPSKRLFVTANSARGGVYSPQDERIFLGGDRTNDYVIAHEMGHMLDIKLAGEGNVDFQAREIREAVAEMYAFDYLRSRVVPGPDVNFQKKLANPASFLNFQNLTYPAHMNGYCRRPDRDEHLNGFILAHAYFKMVQRLGHDTAGHMLAHMSWRLPVWRTYGSVRAAFRQVAFYFYGQNSAVHRAVEDSFDAVGVFDGTTIPANGQNTGCA